MGDKSLIKKSIHKWNELSLDIKTTKTSHSFRKKTKSILTKATTQSHLNIKLEHLKNIFMYNIINGKNIKFTQMQLMIIK